MKHPLETDVMAAWEEPVVHPEAWVAASAVSY